MKNAHKDNENASDSPTSLIGVKGSRQELRPPAWTGTLGYR